MRGQGQSEHPEGEYSLGLHGRDLVALMDALGMKSAHLVGTSYGGELNMVMGIQRGGLAYWELREGKSPRVTPANARVIREVRRSD